VQPIDPDSRARTHLANERTFLAWFRTGVGLIALGVAAPPLLKSTAAVIVAVPAGIIVVAAGISMLVIGRARYHTSRRQIDEADFQPAGASIDISVALFALAGVVAIGAVVLTHL
jgi:putative membrane protein